MGEEKVRLGDGVANVAKKTANDEAKAILIEVIKAFSKKIKEKIPELPDMFDTKIKELVDNQKVIDEIRKEWSEELYEKGLVPKGYSGLPDELLIHNFRQEGYLDGLYVGYILALMSLIDNGADENVILSVRDDVGSNLFGHHYEERDEFINNFKNEKYQTILKQKKERSNLVLEYK